MAGTEVDRLLVEELVRGAAGGDQAAFDQLVERYAGLVWSVARAHRLRDDDAQDVFQTTWLRLVEHLDRIREPRAIGGWLATTARHESLRLLRQADRTRPVTDAQLDRPDTGVDGGESTVLDADRDLALWVAFSGLEDRCQRLLRVLLADPAPSYEEVGAALEMPVGSIGPTRQRCLRHLRRSLRTRGISA
jgi:RNA polymerase sigma factor (sigma-70 family)